MDNFLAERNIWVVEEEVAFIFPKIRLFTFRWNEPMSVAR